MMADLMKSLADPEVMADAQKMMSDPRFQSQMKAMMGDKTVEEVSIRSFEMHREASLSRYLHDARF